MRLAFFATAIAIAAATPAAAAPTYDLVGTRVCLAGNWGQSHHREWRVQLGVFDDERGADRLARVATAFGLATETYIGAWLAGDREPVVVVSPPFRSRSAARLAARRYRVAAAAAFARDFTIWIR